MSKFASNELVTITRQCYAAQRNILLRAQRNAPNEQVQQAYAASVSVLNDAEAQVIERLMENPPKK